MSVGLKPHLPPGAYAMRWRARSAEDQHHTSGQVGFAIGGFDPPVTVSQAAEKVQVLAAAGHVLTFFGLGSSIAALVFDARIDPRPRSRRTVFALGIAAYGVGLVLVVIDTMRVSALTLGQYWATAAGPWMAVRLLAAGVALAGIGLLSRTRLWLCGAALAVAAFAGSMMSHSSHYGLGGAAVHTLHVVATTGWICGLVLLLAGLKRATSAQDARLLARRFGTFALAAVVAMAATGVILSTSIMGPARGLNPWTALGILYGQIVGAKILLAAGMVAAASLNRFVFLKDSAGPRSLRTSVAVEAILGVVVLGLAAVLGTIAPPVTEPASTAPAALHLIGAGNEFGAKFTLTPVPIVGKTVDVRFAVKEIASGAPLAMDNCGRKGCLNFTVLRLDDANATMDGRVARPDGAGAWGTDPLVFVEAGHYRLRLTIQTEYVYHDVVDVEFDVRAD
jgi:putative copper export protein